jgi:hypothetical protein
VYHERISARPSKNSFCEVSGVIRASSLIHVLGSSPEFYETLHTIYPNSSPNYVSFSMNHPITLLRIYNILLHMSL